MVRVRRCDGPAQTPSLGPARAADESIDLAAEFDQQVSVRGRQIFEGDDVRAHLPNLIHVERAARLGAPREVARCHFEAVRGAMVGFGLRKQIDGEGEQRVSLRGW